MGKAEYWWPTYLLLEKFKQLIPAVLDPLPVVGVDDPDERVRLFEMVPPKWAEALLATDIPCEGWAERQSGWKGRYRHQRGEDVVP